MKTLVIDSNYLGYAAAYSMGDLSHEDEATGVLFGFMSRVLSMGLSFETNDIVFCWDSKTSKRRELHSFYKESRQIKNLSQEDAERKRIIYKQFTILRREILPKIGFKNVFVQKGYESDDLIARTVKKWRGEFIIVTSDEDLFQCIRSNVKVYLPRKKKMMTRRRFWDEYGVLPKKWKAVKRIAGCPGDGVPGVERIGEKTALKYLRGELKESSVAFKKIENKEGAEIYERNGSLVVLPFKGTKTPEKKCNVFSVRGLKEVAEEYGMESFLSGDRIKEWKQFFKGEFE